MPGRTTILLTVFLAGCQTLQLDGPVRVEDGDWWTTGGSAARNAAVDTSIEPPLVEAWSYNALAAFGPGSPIVVDGVALIATRQGNLHAIDIATGKGLGQHSFKESVEGTPALSGSQLIVGNAWGRRTLQAYDLQRATKLWRQDGSRVLAGLLPHDDGVLVADVEGVVRFLNAADGTERWRYEDPGGTTVRVAPLLASGLFVVAHENGTVRAFRPADGQVEWTARLGVPVYAAPAADGDHLYVPTTRGILFAINARSGRVAWQYGTGDSDVRLAPPAIRDGVIYFGSSDGWVRAISDDFGETKWRVRLPAAVAAQVLATGRHVYVGTMKNRLVALDAANGTEVWSTTVRGRIKSSMAVADGGIIVLTEPRFVYMFTPENANATH